MDLLIEIKQRVFLDTKILDKDVERNAL